MRDDIRMSEDEVREFLRGGRTMILTTNGPRGYPHAVAMFYGLDDDGTVRIATYEHSQKVKNLKRDPKATLIVESGKAYEELRGVMIEGLAEISKDLDATVTTMVEAMASTDDALPDVAELPETVKRQMAGKRVLVRIRPERVVSWDHGKLPKSKTPGSLG